MTADRRAALVEKMISTFNGNYHNGLTNALSAALDLALEEAAKVAEYRSGSPEWSADTNSGYECAARTIAAAIRAMKGKA